MGKGIGGMGGGAGWGAIATQLIRQKKNIFVNEIVS